MKPIRIIWTLAAILVGLNLNAVARATTYYVDPVNGVDTNDGLSVATAVKTISKAGTLASGGDTVYLRGTGHFPYSYFDKANWSGTAGKVITVEAYPGETAIFDPGHPQFKSNPNTAWEPNTDPAAHPDEYISTSTFTTETAYGSFLQANGQTGDRLLNYARLEDLRATNESFLKVPLSDPRPGQPIMGDTSNKFPWTYSGPGMWWNNDTASPNYQKIHFRASPTHYNTTGVTDYTGGTDPRNMSLSVSSFYTTSVPTSLPSAVTILADYITFKNILFQNGGSGETISLGSSTADTSYVTLDHCTIYTSRYGIRHSRTRSFKLLHCVIDSRLASYTCRTDTKNNWNFLDDQGKSVYTDATSRTSQMQLTSGTTSSDMEIAYCEFRNGHDAVQLYDVRTKVHHCLFENFNDEAVSLQYGAATDDVEVYNNLIRKSLSVFSFAGEASIPGQRYVYRNVVDSRLPTLGFRIFPPDVPGFQETKYWRPATDFKMRHPIDELYYYQNTLIQGDPGFAEATAFWGAALATYPKTRRFMNNLYMTIGVDKPLHKIPDPGHPSLSDGNLWSRRTTTAVSELYRSVTAGIFNTWQNLQSSALRTTFYNANGVGWETHPGDPPTPIAYGQFLNVPDFVYTDGQDRTFPPTTDYRLKSTSPARGAGADLTGTGWPDSEAADSTPDIGALPYGASAVAVGVDGRFTFPDATTPVAEAGDYSNLTDSNNNGFETVNVDGTGSSDPDGTIASYLWKLNGQAIATASTGSIGLPVGTHQISLTVTDSSSNTAQDMREVTIAGSDNITRNPSFENGTTDWNFSQGSAASIVTNPVRLGAYALQSPSVTGVDTIVTQNVPVTPGTALTYSGWVSGVDFSGAQKYSKLSIRWLNSSGGQVSWAEGVANFNTPYILRTQFLTVPASAVTAQVYLAVTKNSAPGTAFFDDIFVAIADNKLLNSHFEKGINSWVVGRGTPSVITHSILARTVNGAAKLTGQPSDYQQLYQNVPATQGQVLFISGWIKTENWPAGKSAHLKARWVNSSNQVISTPWTGSVGSTATTYTQVSTTLPAAPAGAAYLRAVLEIDLAASPGVAYYDDIYIK